MLTGKQWFDAEVLPAVQLVDKRLVLRQLAADVWVMSLERFLALLP